VLLFENFTARGSAPEFSCLKIGLCSTYFRSRAK
jgi:hypothetical protein